ncbi:hypothetical protein [Bdellovibrio sp. HCB-162]|uniref:hypothetical protein n=1 Tax=Bdellovibrio sp. HCB-162 TaxID=3394234 RepID=UPI0039BC489B
MNIAQHLVLSALISFGTFAQAQEPTPAAPPASTPAPAEAQEEIPAPQRSLLKTAATRDFNKPLYFDQIDNGVILPPLELEYDLTGDKGKTLKIGNVLFNEKNFFFALLPLGKTHSQLNQILGSSEAAKTTLVMAWPDKLMTHGTLEMISRTGAVLWTYNFTEADHTKWAKQLEEWRKALITKGVPAKDLIRAGVFGSQFAIVDAEAAKAPFWGQKESFRFCLTQTDGRNSTKMCSQRYGTKSSGRNVIMGKVRTDATTPRVLVQNEEAPMKNSVVVAADMPTSFFAELASGESYEFVTVPNKLELMDIADTKKPSVLRIVGYDTRPIGRSIILNPDQYSSLTKLLGFEATIGDPRKFWAAAIKKDDPKIYLPGQGGGVFKQRFELSEIPRTQSRAYLSKRTPTGTYIDGIKLEGRKQPVAEVSSDQNSVEVDPRDPASFVWKFKATERGQINRSYLNVTVDGKTYKSYYEIYKGFPRELSGRFTGVQAKSDFIIMGEVAYNQWFEDLFGWTNYWLSRQRWGFSAKYFQSFNQLKVDTAGNTAPLSVMTVDLKYRVTPGLWGRDESVGGMLSYQNVTFDKLKAPMLGVGAFWARSMPKVFDDFFNLLPIMRYPKWVDMEFIYYMSSMDSKVTLNAPMSLNFHGKVLWSDRYFGEAGFGMKRYSFTDSSLNQKAELNTFYGTVGLGINF